MGTPSPPQKTRLDRLRDPKRGTKGGGQEKKKSERVASMGQSGAGGRTERRIEWCRCGGSQTKKNRFPDRPKRVEKFNSAGVCGTACMGRVKQEKFWEVRQARHTQQGQDRELYPFLQLIGELLHCSTPATPSRPKPKKRMREKKRQKSVLGSETS